MKSKLSRIVIGSDITGMLIALKLDAVFIPVSFYPSFGWEYDLDFMPDFLFKLKTFCPQPRTRLFIKQNHTKQNSLEITQIKENNKIIIPKMFYWELEYFLNILLTLSSKIYDYSFKRADISSDSVILTTNSGSSDVVEFDKCYIINPGSHFISSDTIKPIEIIESETAHLLYHINIRHENENATGVGFKNNIDHIKDAKYQFNKIWYGKPFGKSLLNWGIHNKTKEKVFTAQDLTVICENVPIEDINDDIYDIFAIKKAVWKYFAPTHKRIRDLVTKYEKSIDKIILSTNISLYENTDKIEFIYYENKKEIINEENLDPKCWQVSSQSILYKIMNQIIYSLLTNESLPKSIF